MANKIQGSPKGIAPVPLSILDVVFTGRGYAATDAFQASIKLAKLADGRGFNRYWVAEHHGMPAVATSSPAILLSRLIGETNHIRLGSGGMMLPNSPPLVIAEQFGMLEALAPGRIDLGIGRAPGTDRMTAAALRQGKVGVEDFPAHLDELLHFLRDDFPNDHPYSNRVFAVPGPGQDKENGLIRPLQYPPVWPLGSSGYSAQLAGQLGLPFAFAAQLAPENLNLAFELYRKNFKPSEMLQKPYTMACFAVFAAHNELEAYKQSRSFAHSMMRMMTGKSYLLLSPDEVDSYHYDDDESQIIEMWHDKVIYGTPEQVVKKLNLLQNTTSADELMIANVGYSLDANYNSVQLIADQYKMPVFLKEK